MIDLRDVRCFVIICDARFVLPKFERRRIELEQGVDLGTLRAYCLDRPGAADEHPFGPGALVMKVGGKIFAIIAENEDPLSISLKCDPDEVALLRETFEDVAPGYHLNKKHWNTVRLTGSITFRQIQDWIDDSYDLVYEGLPRRVREELASP